MWGLSVIGVVVGVIVGAKIGLIFRLTGRGQCCGVQKRSMGFRGSDSGVGVISG